MRRPTEYQELKRFLYHAKEYTGRLTGPQANSMIQDSCVDAFNGLEWEQQQEIGKVKNMLIANFNALGEKGALELIAALGDYMNHNGNGHKESEVE